MRGARGRLHVQRGGRGPGLDPGVEIKVRARLGGDEKEDKEIVVLGRLVTLRSWGYEYQADPKNKAIILEKFGLDGKS